jgi:hypothetical protein
MIILFDMLDLLVEGGAPMPIHMVVSPAQLPLDLANVLCASPGVAYSIQAFISVAESTGTQGSSALFSVDAVEATVESGETSGLLSVVGPLLQAANPKAAMQKAKVIFFMLQIFVNVINEANKNPLYDGKKLACHS